MRLLSTLWIVLLGTSLLLGLTGCAPAATKEDPVPEVTITLEEARQVQNQTLAELMAYVPQDQIVDDHDGPVAKAEAMTCSGPEGYIFLPGWYSAEVNPDLDLDTILERIHTDYSAKEGWKASWRRPEQGQKLDLFSPDDYQYILTRLPNPDGKKGALELTISSFSPCFLEPEGFDIFKKY